MTLDWDWAAAEAEGQRALAIDPTNPLRCRRPEGSLRRSAVGTTRSGNFARRSSVIRSTPMRSATSEWPITAQVDSQKPKRMYRKLLELEPGFVWTRGYLGKTLLAQGKPEAALAMVQQEADEADRLVYPPGRVAGSRPSGRGGRGAESANRAMGRHGRVLCGA